MESFTLARDRWEEVIVDDNGDPIDIAPDVGARYIATELPDMVDDAYIAGSVILWDGPGGILGVAATAAINQDSNGKLHPKAGSMVFDEADVQDMINFGTWTNVILHEMGHVIGIGLLWKLNQLHSGIKTDDEYKGSEAKQVWEDMGCSGPLPVETDGSSGTAGFHWDETCLRGELMPVQKSISALAKVQRLRVCKVSSMSRSYTHAVSKDQARILL
jgi:hypothetical protein